ncbi:hypothetical protein [Polaromonas jejuensis]|uniref:Secreted protein n=1 Tax=Polaromonas jejuensis TaxID=457502 RepID=A0ABW0QG63_9BURK|nr:hypothetical protein [Polaromonas jejuensis]
MAFSAPSAHAAFVVTHSGCAFMMTHFALAFVVTHSTLGAGGTSGRSHSAHAYVVAETFSALESMTTVVEPIMITMEPVMTMTTV